ncbi:hypothetical protein Agub_g8298, partial [Astrephomene gubernaculifera]
GIGYGIVLITGLVPHFGLMKSSSRLPPGIAAGSGWAQLDIVTSVPFTKRADAVRLQQQQQASRQRPRRDKFRVLLACIAIGVVLSISITWYLQRQLPEVQKRVQESQALTAPPSRSFCSRSRPPMVCAHGGDTRHAPPNTAAAFRAALAAGVDCVEVDAALSSDGVLVVTHVRELAQLTGRAGVQAGDLTSSQLLSLRWPGGEGLLRVEQAVALTSPFVDCVTLDVKTYNDEAGRPLDEAAISSALVSLVHSTRCGNCLIWAKSDAVVRRILQLSPGQRTGYILMNETQEARRLGMHHPLRFSTSPDRRRRLAAEAAAAAADRGEDADTAYEDDGNGADSGQGLEQGVKQQGQQQQGGGQQPYYQQQPQQQPGVVGVHMDMVEAGLLELLHGEGKQLFAWTINRPEVLRRVLDVGVDAVVTNHPATALEAIETRLARCGSGGGSSSRGGGGGGEGGEGEAPLIRSRSSRGKERRSGGIRRSSTGGSGGDYL